MFWRNLKSDVSSLSVEPHEADAIISAVHEGTEIESHRTEPYGEVTLIRFTCPVLNEFRWAVKTYRVHSEIVDFETESAASRHLEQRKRDLEEQ